MVEFVSYDGKYPNLCSGILVIKIDGKTVTLPRYCLVPGGGTNWRQDLVLEGPWELDEMFFPKEYEPYKNDILCVINKNIPWGCCGGCL